MNSEQFVEDYLVNLGFRPKRFAKSELRVPGNKTPDFRVFRSDSLEFYCEVKELTDADPLEDHMYEVSPGLKRGEQLDDGKSAMNRLVRKIEDSVEKFRCVNSEHKHLNVLALVNTFDGAVPECLLELLQGFLTHGDSGQYVTTPQFLRDRVSAIRNEVDLYWWVESHAFANPPKHFWLSPHPEDGAIFTRLKELFPAPH